MALSSGAREHKFTFYSRKASQSLTQSQVNKQDRKYQNKMIINMYEYVNKYEPEKGKWNAKGKRRTERARERDKNNSNDNKKSNESAIRIKPMLLLVRILHWVTQHMSTHKTIAWMKQWMPHTFDQYVLTNSAKLRVFQFEGKKLGIYQLLGVCNTNHHLCQSNGKMLSENLIAERAQLGSAQLSAHSWSSETMNFAWCVCVRVCVCNVILL